MPKHKQLTYVNEELLHVNIVNEYVMMVLYDYVNKTGKVLHTAVVNIILTWPVVISMIKNCCKVIMSRSWDVN